MKVPFILRVLRSIDARLGETGAFLLMLATVPLPWTLLDVRNGPQINLALLGVIAFSGLCIWARAMDSRGHKAMRRLAKGSEPTDADRQYAEWLGCDVDADETRISAAFKRKAFADHVDRGGPGTLDMDLALRVRDHLIRRRGERGAPSADAMLDAWERTSGRLGRLWGATFPGQRLLRLQAETGRSLFPTIIRRRAARAI